MVVMKREAILKENYLNSPKTDYASKDLVEVSNVMAFEFKSQYDEFVSTLTKVQGVLLDRLGREEIIKRKPFPRYLNQSEAIAYIGKKKIFDLLVQDYGLKPVMQTHKGTLYCSRHVEELCIQFEQSKWG